MIPIPACCPCSEICSQESKAMNRLGVGWAALGLGELQSPEHFLFGQAFILQSWGRWVP